jgi:hypothetical protein
VGIDKAVNPPHPISRRANPDTQIKIFRKCYSG